MKPRIQSKLGITISPRGLEVAELVTEPGVGSGWRVARCEAIPVGQSAEGAPVWPVEKLQQFRPRRGMTVPEVFTGLDSASVLCRIVSLPTANDAELGPMLENQIETLSPLPPEQVVYSYEVISKTEKQSDLLVAIARRDAVMERLEVLRQAGFPADAMDVETLALLAWLRHEQALPAAELAEMVLVVLEGQLATLVLTHAGALQLIATGQTNLRYVFEASTDLVQWTKIAVLGQRTTGQLPGAATTASDKPNRLLLPTGGLRSALDRRCARWFSVSYEVDHDAQA